MEHATIQITMRAVHIVSAIFLVGGLSFFILCLWPAVRLLDDSFGDSWMKMVQQRFARVMWASVAGLVVSGVYNWMLNVRTYKEMGAAGNALIGSKVLIALILFAVLWAGSIGWMKPKVSQRVAIHLATVVILLAVALRYFRLEYLQSIGG